MTGSDISRRGLVAGGLAAAGTLPARSIRWSLKDL
jgi:hypothetical protein